MNGVHGLSEEEWVALASLQAREALPLPHRLAVGLEGRGLVGRTIFGDLWRLTGPGLEALKRRPPSRGPLGPRSFGPR